LCRDVILGEFDRRIVDIEFMDLFVGSPWSDRTGEAGGTRPGGVHL
jgi:hypothetical protein